MNNLEKMIFAEAEKENTKSRILSDAELIRGGAEIRDDGSLGVTEEQRKEVKKDMEKEIKEGDVSKIAETRKNLHEIPSVKEKSPERLLDLEYQLEDFKGTDYKRDLLLKFRDYYKTVRENIKREPATELTKEEQGIIKGVEKLPLNANDKWDLLLVWRKLKPATDLHIFGMGSKFSRWNNGRRIKKILNQMNLGYEERFVKEQDNCLVFEISPDSSTLNVMRAEGARYGKFLEDKKTNPGLEHVMDFEKAGMFYGFPKTAIQAHEDSKLNNNTDNLKAKEEIPDNINKYKTFNYSKDNWQEEAKTSIRWARELALLSPKLFRERFKDDN